MDGAGRRDEVAAAIGLTGNLRCGAAAIKRLDAN